MAVKDGAVETGVPTEQHADGEKGRDCQKPGVSQTGKKKTPSQPQRWGALALSVIEDQWFLITLGLLIAVASQVQVPAAQQHVKTVIVTYLCLSIIFFVTGCTLDTAVLIQNYSRWRIHIFVQVQCFLMVSGTVYGVVSATATNKSFMDPGLLVGLIFFSCVPTTISSNVVMTGQAKGNKALTVVQTSLGNLIGVFVTPALVVMYTGTDTWYNHVLPPGSGHWGAIYPRVLKQLGLSLYVPLAVGQLVRWKFKPWCQKLFVDWKLNKLGSVALLLIIWQSYDQAFEIGAFTSVPGSNIVFVAFIGVGIWLFAFAIAISTSLLWLPRKDVVSVCYCVPAKGPAMGVPLATTIFAGIEPTLQSKIQIPIIIYQGIQIMFGSIMITIFRRWIEAEERANAKSGQEQDHCIVSEQSREVEAEVGRLSKDVK